MDWLNYHHLQYFWHVAREGSISAACRKLNLAQPTVSGQLRSLEGQVGGKLYNRKGRQVVLTDLGQTVFRYADDIFSIGEELIDVVNGRTENGLSKLTVGVPDVLPKLVSYRLLRPIFDRSDEFQLVVREGSLKYLLTLLASHELDVVFSDTPTGALVSVKAFNHPLGQSEVALFGTQTLVDQYGHSQPDSMDTAPLLLPREGTTLRRSIDHWLSQISPTFRVLGEFDDTALMKVFAEASLGFVPAPVAIEKDLSEKFGLVRLCVIPNVIEVFYAISIERKLRHPAIAAISELARQDLFGSIDEQPNK